MARRSWTVSELAGAAGLDIEQTLLALWGEGIEYPDSPSSRIRADDVRAAEAATGFAGDRRRRVAYWEEHLGISRAQLGALLVELGFALNARASNLPKGAIRRLSEHSKALPSALPSEESVQLPPAPPFEWSCVGQTKPVLTVTTQEVLFVHEELERDFAASDDPISPAGVKSHGLLESAVSRQDAGYGSERKYTTVVSTAAALLHSLVQNHAFFNGNKRSALVSMLVMLDKNGLMLGSNQDELFRWMLRVAGHELLTPGFEYDNRADRETFLISEWIHERSRPVRRDERSVTWISLNRILKKFGCEIIRRGERMEISREVQVRKRSLLKREKFEILKSSFVNTSDGREVPKKQLKRIRDELRLNEANGVDSAAFFGRNKQADDFIAEYSTLLRRLARV